MENQNPKPMNKPVKALRIVMGLIVLVLVALGYASYRNPELFRAAITETGTAPSVPTLFIPAYTAQPGDTGTISLKTTKAFTGLEAMTFSLKVTPASALTFKSDLVTDASTVLSGLTGGVASQPSGDVSVQFLLTGDPVDVAVNGTLVKLPVEVNPSLPAGAVITLTVEPASVVQQLLDNNNNPYDKIVTEPILAGVITVAAADRLQVLQAEALDATHVAVTFSDDLSSVGTVSRYGVKESGTGNVLNVGDVARADQTVLFKAYGQNTVILTLDTAQTPQRLYQVNVIAGNSPNDVSGNVQRGLAAGFRQASFEGYGVATSVVSDFAMASALADGYRSAKVILTHPVNPASVNTSAFTLVELPATSVPILSVQASGSTLTLTTGANLKKSAQYRFGVISPTGAEAPRRLSDGAVLGIPQITFNGFKNGPRVSGATVAPEGTAYRLTINFETDGALQSAGGNFGTVYDLANGAVISTFNASNPDLTVSAKSLELKNFPNDPAKVYVFAADAVQDGSGAVIDPAANTFVFGGANTLSSPAVTGKGTLEVRPSQAVSGNLITKMGLIYFTPAPLPQVISSAVYDSASSLIKLESASAWVAGRQYTLLLKNDSGTVIGWTPFTLEPGLSVVSALASGAGDVDVTFSEGVDMTTVLPAGFTLDGNAVFQNVTRPDPARYDLLRLTLNAGSLVPGQVYTLGVTGDVRAYAGKKPLAVSEAAFSGYQSVAAASTVQLSKIQSLSASQVALEFSGTVNAAAVKPLDLEIKFLEPAPGGLLTLTGVQASGNTQLLLTTENQVPDRRYFVRMVNVADTAGKKLLNQRVLSFTGYLLPAPVVSTAQLDTVTNEAAKTVNVTGRNLQNVQSAWIGGTQVKLTPVSDTAVSLEIPQGLAAGTYDIALVDLAGNRQTATRITVAEPLVPLRVVAEGSRATPLSGVPNDGQTKVRLNVLVEGPGVDQVSAVTIDLQQIGGPQAAAMQKAEKTADGQYYVFETTIPPTTSTKADPYELTVTVKKGAESLKGIATVIVNNQALKSIAPSIDQLYVSPASVAPDEISAFTVSAQITDPDGAETIASVVADLGAVGRGFAVLKASDTAAGQVTRFYASDPLTVPKTVKVGTYPISLVVSDTTGQSVKKTVNLEVSVSLTGPAVDGKKSYLAPRNSVPRDGKTTFSINAYVSDPDGLGDILSVTADFGILGLPPATLKKSADSPAEAKVGWFMADGLTLAPTAPRGVFPIEITATDKSGAIANAILQIDAADQDTLGDPPHIFTDRSYTTPRVAINDGATAVTLNAFVGDGDGDLDTVVANLGAIGQVGAETVPELGATAAVAPAAGVSADLCQTHSQTLVCMQPSLKEGAEGQWFVLPGVTIRTATAASSEPYPVEIIATDKTGKVSRGVIAVYVNNGEAFTNDAQPPHLVLATATTPTSVEALFSEEVAATSLSAAGSEFTLTDRNDVNARLPILAATINASGTLVTLTTDVQEPGKDYVLSVSSKVTDAVGVPLIAGAGNRVPVTGFRADERPPVVEYIAATDVDTIEVEFRDYLKPSSVKLAPVTAVQQTLTPRPKGVHDFNIEIYDDSAGSKPLPVLGVEFGPAGNLLTIKTAPQTPDARYRVNFKGIASAAGVQSAVSLNKLVKGFKAELVQRRLVSSQADLNGDGKVDFADFTIFSSVYGQSFAKAPEVPAKTGAAAQGLSPITPVPDATVPVTSVPATSSVTVQ